MNTCEGNWKSAVGVLGAISERLFLSAGMWHAVGFLLARSFFSLPRNVCHKKCTVIDYVCEILRDRQQHGESARESSTQR